MIKYGDQYIMVQAKDDPIEDRGGVFVGNWELLEDNFGITEDTLEAWCQFNSYTYTLSRYETKDELINSLYKLRNHLREPNFDAGAGKEFTAGVTSGMEFSAEKLDELINHFVRNTY